MNVFVFGLVMLSSIVILGLLKFVLLSIAFLLAFGAYKIVCWRNRSKKVRLNDEPMMPADRDVSLALSGAPAPQIPDCYLSVRAAGSFTTLFVCTPELASEIYTKRAQELLRWVPFVPQGSLFASEGEDGPAIFLSNHPFSAAYFTFT